MLQASQVGIMLLLRWQAHHKSLEVKGSYMEVCLGLLYWIKEILEMSINLINLDNVGHRKIYIYTVGHTFPKGGAACARPDWICRMNSEGWSTEPGLTAKELLKPVLGELKHWHKKEGGVKEKGRCKGDALNLVKEKVQVTITTTRCIYTFVCNKRYQACVHWERLCL